MDGSEWRKAIKAKIWSLVFLDMRVYMYFDRFEHSRHVSEVFVQYSSRLSNDYYTSSD